MRLETPEKRTDKLRGGYILNALRDYCLGGDAYVQANEVYAIVKREAYKIEYAAFLEDFKYLIREGRICREGSRVYLRETLRYENSAAESLADIMQSNKLPFVAVPNTIAAINGMPLCSEQLEAIRMALSCRLSLVLGGAGTGKSTLIRAIAKCAFEEYQVLCAPTGKAARNLAERTGLPVRTVHSALGVMPDEDFLAPVRWPYVGLVVVDEASMMTLGMLAGILNKVSKKCRVVLLGDPNQLLSVGSGNVIPDLLQLGIPHICLCENHRQEKSSSELQANVVGFASLHCEDDLSYGESFSLRSMNEISVKHAIVDEAVSRYVKGERVQVLSPYNKSTELSVAKLNHLIREHVNPKTTEMKTLGNRFRDGDKVIILHNDRDRNCSNGDVGILRILRDSEEDVLFRVELPDGRCPVWDDINDLKNIALAYALTVHKSQGSEYDTILMPVTDSFGSMLYRNLIYTAISRARCKVILYGSRNALSVALQRPAKERRSQLVSKCNMAVLKCA